jgi:hypothetical protein
MRGPAQDAVLDAGEIAGAQGHLRPAVGARGELLGVMPPAFSRVGGSQGVERDADLLDFTAGMS